MVSLHLWISGWNARWFENGSSNDGSRSSTWPAKAIWKGRDAPGVRSFQPGNSQEVGFNMSQHGSTSEFSFNIKYSLSIGSWKL